VNHVWKAHQRLFYSRMVLFQRRLVKRNECGLPCQLLSNLLRERAAVHAACIHAACIHAACIHATGAHATHRGTATER
jgi:hypothetical protein